MKNAYAWNYTDWNICCRQDKHVSGGIVESGIQHAYIGKIQTEYVCMYNVVKVAIF